MLVEAANCASVQALEDVAVVDGKQLLSPLYHRTIRIPANENNWSSSDGWIVKVCASLFCSTKWSKQPGAVVTEHTPQITALLDVPSVLQASL